MPYGSGISRSLLYVSQMTMREAASSPLLEMSCGQLWSNLLTVSRSTWDQNWGLRVSGGPTFVPIRAVLLLTDLKCELPEKVLLEDVLRL